MVRLYFLFVCLLAIQLLNRTSACFESPLFFSYYSIQLLSIANSTYFFSTEPTLASVTSQSQGTKKKKTMKIVRSLLLTISVSVYLLPLLFQVCLGEDPSPLYYEEPSKFPVWPPPPTLFSHVNCFLQLGACGESTTTTSSSIGEQVSVVNYICLNHDGNIDAADNEDLVQSARNRDSQSRTQSFLIKTRDFLNFTMQFQTNLGREFCSSCRDVCQGTTDVYHGANSNHMQNNNNNGNNANYNPTNAEDPTYYDANNNNNNNGNNNNNNGNNANYIPTDDEDPTYYNANNNNNANNANSNSNYNNNNNYFSNMNNNYNNANNYDNLGQVPNYFLLPTGSAFQSKPGELFAYDCKDCLLECQERNVVEQPGDLIPSDFYSFSAGACAAEVPDGSDMFLGSTVLPFCQLNYFSFPNAKACNDTTTGNTTTGTTTSNNDPIAVFGPTARAIYNTVATTVMPCIVPSYTGQTSNHWCDAILEMAQPCSALSNNTTNEMELCEQGQQVVEETPMPPRLPEDLPVVLPQGDSDAPDTILNMTHNSLRFLECQSAEYVDSETSRPYQEHYAVFRMCTKMDLKPLFTEQQCSANYCFDYVIELSWYMNITSNHLHQLNEKACTECYDRCLSYNNNNNNVDGNVAGNDQNIAVCDWCLRADDNDESTSTDYTRYCWDANPRTDSDWFLYSSLVPSAEAWSCDICTDTCYRTKTMVDRGFIIDATDFAMCSKISGGTNVTAGPVCAATTTSSTMTTPSFGGGSSSSSSSNNNDEMSASASRSGTTGTRRNNNNNNPVKIGLFEDAACRFPHSSGGGGTVEDYYLGSDDDGVGSVNEVAMFYFYHDMITANLDKKSLSCLDPDDQNMTNVMCQELKDLAVPCPPVGESIGWVATGGGSNRQRTSSASASSTFPKDGNVKNNNKNHIRSEEEYMRMFTMCPGKEEETEVPYVAENANNANGGGVSIGTWSTTIFAIVAEGLMAWLMVFVL